VADWYYIGHYGQLGPLTREQIDELIQSGVIVRDTYVWRSGMSDWIAADRAAELSESFRAAEPFAAPPPPPSPTARTVTAPAPPPVAPAPFASYRFDPMPAPSQQPFYPAFGGVKSDRSRALGGVLQLIIPGVGRMYLGYAAIGVLQLVLTLCMLGWIWSVIDGIIILIGGVKLDGYGRQLND